MPTFRPQVAVPDTPLVCAFDSKRAAVFLSDVKGESFVEPRRAGGQVWTVRQGGPHRIWTRIEDALAGWYAIGSPDIAAVPRRINRERHECWIEGDNRL